MKLYIIFILFLFAPVKTLFALNDTADFTNRFQNSAQRLFKNVKSKQETYPNARTPPLAELAGPVHNKEGIRDDILQYIIKTIPEDNKKVLHAAIKYAASLQYIYYKATEEEAMKASITESIALDCLSETLPDWIDFSRKIEQLMRNTSERDKRMWYVDEKYFSWKLIGNGGLSSDQLTMKCEKGDY